MGTPVVERRAIRAESTRKEDTGSHVVTVNVDGQEFNVARQLGAINYDRFPQEIEEVGSQAFWLSELAGRALRERRIAEMRADVVKAETAQRIRRDRARLGEKVTENAIAEEVTLDRACQAAIMKAIDAESNEKMLRGFHFAIEEKQRILRELIPTAYLEHPRSADDLKSRFRRRTANHEGR